MRQNQAGATAVEFALVLMLLLTFMLGVVDFSRMLFTWNAVNEAARAGARYAVVCHDGVSGAGAVLARMQALVPSIASVDLEWSPSGCNSTTCERVTLTIPDLQFRWISPIAGIGGIDLLAMPTFRTTLVRESMRQDVNSGVMC